MCSGIRCFPITAAASRQGWKLKLATCRRTAMTRKDCVLNCWKTAGEPASSTTMESFCRRREEKSRTKLSYGGGMEAFRSRQQELSYYHRDGHLSTTFYHRRTAWRCSENYQYDAFGVPLDNDTTVNTKFVTSASSMIN